MTRLEQHPVKFPNRSNSFSSLRTCLKSTVNTTLIKKTIPRSIHPYRLYFAFQFIALLYLRIRLPCSTMFASSMRSLNLTRRKYEDQKYYRQPTSKKPSPTRVPGKRKLSCKRTSLFGCLVIPITETQRRAYGHGNRRKSAT